MAADSKASQDAEPTGAKAWPCGDKLDKKIFGQALPASLNYLVLPMQGLVDLYFLGMLGNTLVMAGQGAANQVYTTAGLLYSTLPGVTLPLVAKAYAAGNQQDVQKQVGGALFLSAVLGGLVTIIVGLGNSYWLRAVGASPSTVIFALPYLIYRLIGVIPDIASTVSASSLQGALDTKSPLTVSLIALITNAICNYFLIFQAGMGIAGAALATSVAQVVSGAVYFNKLLRRKLVTWSTALRPPSKEMFSRLAGSVGALQVRNIALNAAFIGITRQVQSLDATGIAAAAHNVAIQVWLVGGVFLLALGTVANSLTSAELGRPGSTPESARFVAKRLIAWGAVMGAVLTVAQCAFASPLLSLFSPSLEVKKAALVPYLVGALLQVVNGVVFVGEGLMVAGGAYSLLAVGQVIATVLHLLAIKIAPPTLTALWGCFWVWNAARLASFATFWFTRSPLLPNGRPGFWTKEKPA